jgi:hypothetical protein
MREVCYCGRMGEVENRTPVLENGKRALLCPNEACGHTDRLEWLPDEARSLAFEEAERRRARRESAPAA